MRVARALGAAALLSAACLAAGEGAMDEKGRSRFTVEHIRETSARPFAEATAAFEARLGRHDPVPAATLAHGAAPAEVRAAIEKMAGPSGFMIFAKQDHGTLLGLVGARRKVVQYVVGNPLFAVEMTRHDVGAALYAPLRVLTYEPEGGGTCIEYDLPSSLFGRLGDPQVDAVAVDLDRKMADLVAASLR